MLAAYAAGTLTEASRPPQIPADPGDGARLRSPAPTRCMSNEVAGAGTRRRIEKTDSKPCTYDDNGINPSTRIRAATPTRALPTATPSSKTLIGRSALVKKGPQKFALPGLGVELPPRFFLACYLNGYGVDSVRNRDSKPPFVGRAEMRDRLRRPRHPP